MSNFKTYKGYTVYDNGTIFNKRGMEMKQANNSEGYKIITLSASNKRKSYIVHRLMAMLFLPNFNNHPTVDHKDRNRINNSLYNLRWASRSLQCHNTKTSSLNTSGHRGVYFNKRKKWSYWVAYISVENKRIMKTFKLKEDAIKQRLDWEREYLEK